MGICAITRAGVIGQTGTDVEGALRAHGRHAGGKPRKSGDSNARMQKYLFLDGLSNPKIFSNILYEDWRGSQEEEI